MIETRTVDALIPYARNARTHSDEQVAQVAASIREFGFTNPVLIDPQGGIIAGHGRVLAARKLGLESVPVRVVGEDWSEAKKRAYILADNKLALNAGWDFDLLRTELQDLDTGEIRPKPDRLLVGGTGADVDLGARISAGVGRRSREVGRTGTKICFLPSLRQGVRPP